MLKGGTHMKITVATNMNQQEQEILLSHFPNEDFTFKQYHDVTQKEVDTSDILIGNLPRDVDVNRENLKFIQLNSAGSDHYTKEGVMHPKTLLANASGSYGKAIAEHMIGMMLALNKNIPGYVKNMQEGKWHDFRKGKEIYNATVMIVGLGDIGYAIAKRLKAFDAHIIGVKRRISKLPEYVDELYTIDALDAVLPRADYVLLCLPQTKDTIHLFHKERLLKMKPDAMLLNVGRGSAICTEDLIDVLESSHLYGVALDVLEEEPLSKDHPLWRKDNVLITPHCSGGFVWESVREYFLHLVIRNLHHFFNNEELENQVDPETGYRKHNISIK